MKCEIETKLKIENCVCGNNNYHSRECRNHTRKLYLYERAKKIRKEKRAKYICIYGGCKEKIKPTLVYHQFCPKHKPSSKKKDEK